MYTSVLVVCLLAAAVCGAPQFAPQAQFAPPVGAVRPVVPLISRSEVQDDAGQFSLSYRTGDGITFTEQGVLKVNKEGTDNVLVKQGEYEYTAPNGELVKVSYIADENGFQPQSPNIPRQVSAVPAVFV